MPNLRHCRSYALVAAALFAAQSAGAAGLSGEAVAGGFRELFGYVGSSFLLGGAWMAVRITVCAMAIGVVLGLALALMRLSRYKALSGAAWSYIWFVRGTPQLLQLVFIFDALPLIGLRFDAFTTAVIGFALNEAAFSAEMFRSGILSVNRSQSIAAAALGMGPFLTLRRIVMPQSMRALVPGLANDTINMLKLTSIASVIFVNELTFRSQQIVGQNFKFFTVFGAAAVIYLALTSAISVLQIALERRFDYESDHRLRFSFLGLRAARRAVPGEAGGETLREPDVAQPGFEPTPSNDAHAWIRTLLPREDAHAHDGRAPFVVCKKVWKSYGDREILRGVDLTIERGEVVVILGPSGSGKSTLLRLINHLEPMDWGSIKVDSEYVGYREGPNGALRPVRNLARARAQSRIGMVFQHFNLFSHLTALQNVMEAPCRVYSAPRREAETLGRALLASVGLAAHADHLPHRLSGGQQQRVAIARALAVKPKLMLFDEPTSALDPELVGDVLNVMRGLADAGMTMIVVTHEIRFAREVADRVVFMDGGEVIEQGPPEQVIDNPGHERTRKFLNVVAHDAPVPGEVTP
ncbi:polar amino acid ABC transporter permease [Burkholderia sp. WAC0059]|uniref:amino acid ABC transporter permease/ATP-binding protein n=1 Tax=Burkholderia sp. WAC0059 TaxID=2066022 RepID=UPI000C7EFE87|nr:amino acid ABC transporter permease/ATP-binding protein [Burkholderia sp. WAC0059]PLZ02839.1 polar amino acid ABC transporter permease [Burkholderia sp. WAC0059]